MQIGYSPDEVFSRIQHEGIQFIDLQFTGLTGHFHHTTISANTFAVIPWMTENKTARLLCDVYWGEDRGRLSRDPRGIAQNAEKYIKTQGLSLIHI